MLLICIAAQHRLNAHFILAVYELATSLVSTKLLSPPAAVCHDADYAAAVCMLLQVARCTKIINPGTDEAKYVINVKQIAKVQAESELVAFTPTLLCY